MSHLTFAEQQVKNKADFKSGIIMCVLAVVTAVPLFMLIYNRLG